MSEFSEAYYLLTDDLERVITLLRASNTEGFVFPPENGWVTILPRAEFGHPVASLLEANTGTLLNYLFDEDFGWRFGLFMGTSLRSVYACKWLEWEDWDSDEIRSDSSTVDIDLLIDVAVAAGRTARREELEAIVNPRIVQRTTATGETYNDFADWPVEQLDVSPAYAFADLMGLPRYRWLRWRNDAGRWQAEGAVHVMGEVESRGGESNP